MHIPVLKEAVLQYLAPQEGETYLDATAGYGGHAEIVLRATKNAKDSVLIDQDTSATEALQSKYAGQNVQIIHDNFAHAAHRFAEEGKKFDLILADLGISSTHLDNAERGFSFATTAPLDMRMDQSQDLSAEKVVNTYSEKELARVLKQYGEEYKASRLAAEIVNSRPVQTTDQLADIVIKIYGGRRGKTHPATKTFQAIRIEVNGELDQLKQALPMWHELLAPGGRLAVISFHSLEDRIVKEYFSEHSLGYEATLKLLTKKPVSATKNEVVTNPRARSAKLRAVAKIKTERSN